MDELMLMHKDREVAVISIGRDNKGVGYLDVNSVLDSNRLPFGVKSATASNINSLLTQWNDSRCIPIDRPNYEKILSTIGASTSAELISHAYMCSLTDCYWFRPQTENVRWADVNFHQNGFSSNLYKHLFYGANEEPINNLNSPDLTTDGALPKMWQQDADGRYFLFKGHDNAPIEACHEVIADAILTEMGIDHVRYYLDNSSGIIASVCENFIHSDREEFVSIESLMKDSNCIGQFNFLQTLYDLGFKSEMDEMMAADSVIGNLDRHARNYGVIVNSDTQRIERFAPLFDHGGCYLAGNHGFLTYPPTGLSFNKTIPILSDKALSLVENINIRNIANVINPMPLDEQMKKIIVDQLSGRVEKLIAFHERSSYDLDRK